MFCCLVREFVDGEDWKNAVSVRVHDVSGTEPDLVGIVVATLADMEQAEVMVRNLEQNLPYQFRGI